MPFALLGSICREEKWKRTDSKKVNSFSAGDYYNEPTSVLLMRRSPTPSPPTSVSTLSTSLNAGASASADKKDEWANELQPILASAGAARCSLGLDDWETMLPDPVSASAAVDSGHEQSILRWIAGGDIDEASLLGLKQLLQSSNTTHLDFAASTNLGIVDHGSVLDPIANLVSGSGFSSSGFNANAKFDQFPVTVDTSGDSNISLIFQSQPQFNQFVEEKPQPLINQNQNLLIPPPYNHQEHHALPPPSKRHNHLSIGDGVSFGLNTNLQVLQPQLAAAKQEVLQAHGEEETTQNLLDQLYKAAELVGTANFSHAQAILARLNHQLSSVGKPLHRAVYYFKEALQSLLFGNGNHLPRMPTSFDVIFKMGAYKSFSEISPFIQFLNFTANQAFLEALDRCNTIHIVDFGIGFGAQWASFLQELPLRRNGVAAVRITAVTLPSSHHPIELALMHETLSQFSHEVGVSLELQVLNFDCLEQQESVYSDFRATLRTDEAVVVNLPIWCSSDQLLPVIRFIKRLSPRIVVCLDSAYTARTDLPFPQHVLHSLQSCSDLLESLDATVEVASTDAVSRIERFLVLPQIESGLLGRLCSRGEKSSQWRNMLGSAGLTPMPLSDFAEAQAEWLVKRTPTQGFQVDKRHGSLVLCWQRRELVSVSAWRC